MLKRRTMLKTGILLGAIAVSSGVAWAVFGVSRRVEVGRPVPAGERVSMDAVDHDAWDALLQKYVDDDGRVDYRRWLASRTDVAKLDAYLDQLSTASRAKQASTEARLAFWINAYNAVTVKGILREYPTTSIRKHTSLTGYNIWKHLLLPVDGKRYSLEYIEHSILRKMREPRIHFAIVCASIGCPRLWNHAYTSDDLDAQLSRNARHFFGQSGNFRISNGGRTVHLSAILDWFGKDFGPNTARQLRTIAPYVPEDARPLLERGRADVVYLDYDWRLNERR